MSGDAESGVSVPGTGPQTPATPSTAGNVDDETARSKGTGPRDDADAGADRITREQIFELLSNERRRHVLRYFWENEGEAGLGPLATQVAAWENDVAPEAVTSTQRKRAYSALQQSHLPKMDGAGIVSYDSDRGVIVPSDAVADLDIYMEVVPGRELAWREIYLGLGLVSVSLVAAVWLNVYPFVLLPDIAWGGLIAVVLTLSAAANVYHDRSSGFEEFGGSV
jgi:hypothetical protein